MGGNFKNQEGYTDPTAGQAIAQVIKEEKKYRPLVYICSPFSNDPEGNTEKAKRYSRFAVESEAIPFAPHLLLPLYMKEESERGCDMRYIIEETKTEAGKRKIPITEDVAMMFQAIIEYKRDIGRAHNG